MLFGIKDYNVKITSGDEKATDFPVLCKEILHYINCLIENNSVVAETCKEFLISSKYNFNKVFQKPRRLVRIFRFLHLCC